jgi:hypothetical protein
VNRPSLVEMNDARGTPAALAPWHLWLVGVLWLVYSAMSCYSHAMTLTENASYFRATGVTPEIAAYFAAVPAWYVVTWTIGAWGGLLAAVGLLVRKSWAVWSFAVSQLAMAANSVWTLVNPDAYEVFGNVGWIWALTTIALCAFLVFYSMAMKRRCILR